MQSGSAWSSPQLYRERVHPGSPRPPPVRQLLPRRLAERLTLLLFQLALPRPAGARRRSAMNPPLLRVPDPRLLQHVSLRQLRLVADARSSVPWFHRKLVPYQLLLHKLSDDSVDDQARLQLSAAETSPCPQLRRQLLPERRAPASPQAAQPASRRPERHAHAPRLPQPLRRRPFRFS